MNKYIHITSCSEGSNKYPHPYIHHRQIKCTFANRILKVEHVRK